MPRFATLIVLIVPMLASAQAEAPVRTLREAYRAEVLEALKMPPPDADA